MLTLGQQLVLDLVFNVSLWPIGSDSFGVHTAEKCNELTPPRWRPRAKRGQGQDEPESGFGRPAFCAKMVECGADVDQINEALPHIIAHYTQWQAETLQRCLSLDGLQPPQHQKEVAMCELGHTTA